MVQLKITFRDIDILTEDSIKEFSVRILKEVSLGKTSSIIKDSSGSAVGFYSLGNVVRVHNDNINQE